MRYSSLICFIFLLLSPCFAANPVVTLLSPADLYVSPTNATAFIYNVTNTTEIANCSLYTNETDWTIKQTQQFINKTNLTVSSLNVYRGGILSGVIASTYAVDGDLLILSEVTGTPGWNYTFVIGDGVDITKNITLRTYSWYNPSNPGHVTGVGLINKTSGSCDGSNPLSTVGYTWIQTTINASSVKDYIFPDDTIRVCGTHSSPGSVSHQWKIDAMLLEVNIKSDASNEFIQSFSMDGWYRWNVECIDVLGGRAMATANRTIRIDTTTPKIHIYSPTSTLYSSRIIDLNVSSSDSGDVDTWWYNLNAAGNVVFTPNTTITAGYGINTLFIFVNCTAGYQNFTSLNFTVVQPIYVYAASASVCPVSSKLLPLEWILVGVVFGALLVLILGSEAED